MHPSPAHKVPSMYSSKQGSSQGSIQGGGGGPSHQHHVTSMKSISECNAPLETIPGTPTDSVSWMSVNAAATDGTSTVVPTKSLNSPAKSRRRENTQGMMTSQSKQTVFTSHQEATTSSSPKRTSSQHNSPAKQSLAAAEEVYSKKVWGSRSKVSQGQGSPGRQVPARQGTTVHVVNVEENTESHV